MRLGESKAAMKLAIVSVLLIAIATSGCGFLLGESDTGHVGGSGSLSDAAAQARRDTTKMRRADAEKASTPPDVGWTVPNDGASGASVSQSLDAGSSPEGNPGVHGNASNDGVAFLGVVASGGTLGGADYDGFSTIGAHLGISATERWRFDLIGSLGGVNFAGQSVAGQSFKDETELMVDVNVRYYLTPPHTLLSAYPIGGFRLGTLYWDYANPITIVEDGHPQQVTGDQIDFMGIYAGAGVSLLRVRHMQIGTHLVGGVKLYATETKRGLANDVFPDAGFVQVMFEMSYKF